MSDARIPQRQWEEEAWVEFVPPRPRIERRPLAEADISHPKFPASPRRTYRAAQKIADGPLLALTYAVGPLVDAKLSKVLEEDVPTIALSLACSRGVLRATWHRRRAANGTASWTFWSAIIARSDRSGAMMANHKEVMAWLAG